VRKEEKEDGATCNSDGKTEAKTGSKGKVSGMERGRVRGVMGFGTRSTVTGCSSRTLRLLASLEGGAGFVGVDADERLSDGLANNDTT
jgi:hypothetical protein